MGLFKFISQIFAGGKKADDPSSPLKTSHQSRRQIPDTNPADLPLYKVQTVVDGDTVDVFNENSDLRVRLSAIDCPEDDQPWGDTATAGLIKLIGGKQVHLEIHGTDEHKRTIATLYVQHGSQLINVNERMVMLGHAWVTRHYCSHLPRCRKHQLNRIERWAKTKKVGLWKAENPVPPWLWRRQDSA